MKNLLLISNEKIAKDFLEKATGNIYNIIDTDDVDQGLKILEDLADSLIHEAVKHIYLCYSCFDSDR